MSYIKDIEKLEFNQFIEGKIRCWFNLLDVDKDGSLSKRDFRLIAEAFAQENKLDKASQDIVQDKLFNAWCWEEFHGLEEGCCWKGGVPLYCKMIQNFKEERIISEDDFLSAYGQLIGFRPALAQKVLVHMVSVFFDVFDSNKDGYITSDEMLVAMKSLGSDEPLTVVELALECMDQDGDGKLSTQEYIGGWLDFILGQNRNHVLVQAFAPCLCEL